MYTPTNCKVYSSDSDCDGLNKSNQLRVILENSNTDIRSNIVIQVLSGTRIDRAKIIGLIGESREHQSSICKKP